MKCNFNGLNKTKMENIEELLSKRAGHKVKIVIPQKGTKYRLLILAKQNAKITIEQFGDKIRKAKEGRFCGENHHFWNNRINNSQYIHGRQIFKAHSNQSEICENGWNCFRWINALYLV